MRYFGKEGEEMEEIEEQHSDGIKEMERKGKGQRKQDETRKRKKGK